MTRRILGETIQQRLDELGLSGNQLAERVPYDPGGMSRIIAGTRGCRPETAAAIDRALDAGGRICEAAAADARAMASAAEMAKTRLGLEDSLARGMMADAALDNWEQAVESMGRRAWTTAVPLLVHDLTGMLRDLNLAIARHRSASALPRLVRAVAKVSGIMTLALVRAEDQAWQGWAATARAAALEAGDPTTLAWVMACEATGFYCADRLPSAVRAARAARDATAVACGGTARAAGVEMRALARTGDIAGAWSSFRASERLNERLGDEWRAASTLDFTHALQAFQRGECLMQLNDSAALGELDHAQGLCRIEDDSALWAMTRLRKAEYVIQSGDADSGLALAADTLAALDPEEKPGIITTRARELLSSLPSAHREARAARDLQAMLNPLISTRRRSAMNP